METIEKRLKRESESQGESEEDCHARPPDFRALIPFLSMSAYILLWHDPPASLPMILATFLREIMPQSMNSDKDPVITPGS
jgi:hypothetical protein